MVTALGATAASTRDRFAAGARATWTPLPGLERTSLEIAAAAPFDPAALLGRRMLKYMSDTAVLACVAAREALSQAQARERFHHERIGLYAGLGMQSANPSEMHPIIAGSLDERGNVSLEKLGTRGLSAAPPTLSFKILSNMPACLVSILEEVKGPNLVFSPWESQTAAALAEAVQAVESGEVDCAIAGGADAAASPSAVLFLTQSGLLRRGERAGSAAAWLCLGREQPGRRALAQIDRIELVPGDAAASDPLAERLGRTFAAAPAVLLALACLGVPVDPRLVSTDGEEFRAAVTVRA
jgi:3-oxoacyl-[acyl-carrier-protein] synthase II